MEDRIIAYIKYGQRLIDLLQRSAFDEIYLNEYWVNGQRVDVRVFADKSAQLCDLIKAFNDNLIEVRKLIPEYREEIDQLVF